jgi:hypothetical protein
MPALSLFVKVVDQTVFIVKVAIVSVADEAAEKSVPRLRAAPDTDSQTL